jgi:shikimate dehydrogenase
MPDTKLFAVAGNPILHSRSPLIFSALFQECGLDALYFRLSESEGGRIVEMARAVGLHGFNVTAPAKSDIMAHLDSVSEQSGIIQAVNTVTVDEKGRLTGHNTDWIGVVQSLREAGVNLRQKTAAVIGAGGAGRAAVYGLLKGGVKKVILMNRSYDKGKIAASDLGAEFMPLTLLPDALSEANILISCVAGSEAIVPPSLLKKNLVVMEADYRRSPLLGEAQRTGCLTISGKKWLFNQALPAFKLMAGMDPPDISPSVSLSPSSDFPDKSIVALVGFMGSGKTTVGERLAELRGCPFIDTDRVVEEEAGASIPELFQSRGEAYFRCLEKDVIRRLLPESEGCVLALGGGAVLDPENRDLIRRYALPVWLWSSFKPSDPAEISSRPLLNVNRPDAQAASLLKIRLPFYAGICDVAFNTDQRQADEIAKRIKDEVDQTI